MKNRIIAMLMAIALVFSFASCEIWRKKDESGGEQPPSDKNDFTVEIEPVEYNEAQINEASDKIEELISSIVDILGYGKHFDEDRRVQLRDTVAMKVIPVLIDVGIYPEEFFSLLVSADKGLALYGSETEDDIDPKEISDLYTEFISVIDIDRLGALIYEIIMIRLEVLLESAREKYESKENKLNLENLEYYTALVEGARGLGRAKFTDAFSVITFSASLFNGTASITTDGIQLSVEDAFAIIKKQGERFANMTLGETDWQTVAAVGEEFLPDSGKSVKEKLLLSLNYADFFIESADVMPELISFCAGLSSDISADNIELIKNGGKYSYELFLAKELLSDEAALSELLLKIEAKIPAPDSGSVTAIKSYDKAGYLAFCENYNATKDELLGALNTFANSATDENYEVLRRAYFGYFANVNSVVAYVYLYS